MTIARVLAGEQRWHLEIGEVVDVLRSHPADSFDALLCDPPYGFKFMGKSWDYEVPSVDLWRECLRVMKPGAPLVAFGGSRTYHRLACGIEDAGFELRDCLMWLYGKGFPKSQNIGLAIDKAAGAVREVVGTRKLGGTARIKGGQGNATAGRAAEFYATHEVRDFIDVAAPSTALAKAWDGYGTALKPGHEPIVLARKPLAGTMVQNVRAFGVGGLAIDACRIGTEIVGWGGDGRGPQGTWDEGACGIRAGEARPVEGRWPANLLLSHTEDCRVFGKKKKKKKPAKWSSPRGGIWRTDSNAKAELTGGGEYEGERYECSPDCPIRLLDEQAGNRPSRPSVTRNGGGGGMVPLAELSGIARPDSGYEDDGGPSRFFFCSKVSTAEREFGCELLPMRSAGEVTDREDDSDGLESPRAGAGRTGGARNHHPTLKPIALIRWLARLIMPPCPGTILVPFAGAGSEVIGCRRAGWPRVFGIERDRDGNGRPLGYEQVARARIARWEQVRPDLDEHEAIDSANASAVSEKQESLFK